MGRATAKLPSDIPTDSTLLYSFVDPESQKLKLALTHPSFDPVSDTGYVKNKLLEVTPIKKEEVTEGYVGEKLTESDEWSRFV